MSSTVVVLNNASVTASGSFLTDIGSDQEVILFWNIMNPITGSSPTIQFTLQEIDPSDDVSQNGQSVSSAVISSASVGNKVLSLTNSNKILISWTVTGSSPVFSNVNLISVSKDVGNVISVISGPGRSTINSTSVAASVTNVTLLAANENRLGATFWNDSSSATLYLKLGTTASTSSYTAQLLPSGYYEVPYNYTGEIDGIWSAAVGNVRISELI